MEMVMEDSRFSSSHPFHSIAFEALAASVRTRRAGDSDLVIPGVLIKDGVSDLTVSSFGFGKIAARFYEKNGVSNAISRMWCKWLGKEAPRNDDKLKVPKHDFAVVSFVYNCDLGRKGLLDNVKSLLTYAFPIELDNGEAASTQWKKSFSDPEDISESLSNQYDSSGEDSSASNRASSRLALDRYDDQLLLTRFISSKAIRRELTRQQRIAAERMCDICQQKMLPEKDVATLINLNTGKLVCSSRNVNGAFHLERIENHSVNPKVKRRSRRKNGAKCNAMGKDGETKDTETLISSVFCPECQVTGIEVKVDELEKPDVSLSHEKVLPLKSLHFYSADKSETMVVMKTMNCTSGIGYYLLFFEGAL
ncbi:hypothetical protein CRYUN_Cryun18bG0056800 [Craigia yunnanensis]